ncbi:LysR family transcriptional regulator [Streptomyces gilvosporeus]|nr:LysR family transcriptional regulator [Streptomyces gilvosporeus]
MNHSGLLRRVEYFLAVAEELHLGRAAERCHVTQPTLSQQIKVLEKELETRLLERSKTGISLTAAGEILRHEAPHLLGHIHSMRTKLKAASSEGHRLVRVAFSRAGHALGQRAMVAEFRRDHPAVNVTIASGWSDGNVRLVRAREVDFAFVRPPIAADDLQLHVVGSSEIVMLAPTQLTRSTGPAPAELPLIMWPRDQAPGYYDHLLRIIGREGVGHVVREEPDYANIASAVAAGDGISFMDRGIAEWLTHGEDTQVLRLRASAAHAPLGVISRRDQDENLANRFVLACRRATATELSPTPGGFPVGSVRPTFGVPGDRESDVR